ncbi:MAG TPA: LysE family transporter [Acidimicrobiia bacterium]|nr:LysE family transporter [Acidimicrobiia bacterium]
MVHAFVNGLLAGYGIAIPVGAIAVLIVDTGIRNGFRTAAAAGAGAATADLLYAATAAAGGAAVASAVSSVQMPFRYASALVLATIAVVGLIGAARQGPRRLPVGPSGVTAGVARTYRKFVGLTIINPLTIVYFTVFVVGSGIATGLSPAEGTVFAVAAFAASLSWQTLLAGIGGVAHHALPGRFRIGATVAGNLIVLALAAAVAFG